MTEKFLIVGPWTYKLFMWPAVDPGIALGAEVLKENDHIQNERSWLEKVEEENCAAFFPLPRRSKVMSCSCEFGEK